MQANELVGRVIVALLFAISFTLIGWTAPVLYATHAPADNFIEVNQFSAQDANPSSKSHYICFDRTVHQASSGTVYTELFLVNDKGERVEMTNGETMDRYFQDGRSRVVTPMVLPENLESGKYRYLIVTEMNLADDRVSRAFEATSEPFVINESVDVERDRQDFHCNK